MSEIHQQAIDYVYLQVLQKLQCHYSHRQRLALEELIRRVTEAAGGHGRLGQFKVMIAHNGGRDSTQAVAFLRAAQLSLPLRCGQTFDLRIVTPRQDAVTEPASSNLQRLYAALFIQEDPRVEALMADEHQVQAFALPDRGLDPMPDEQRHALLMAGQLTGGDIRATFCHADHQRLARGLRRSLSWRGEVGALVRLEPPRQRNQYLLWSRQVGRRAQALHGQCSESASPAMLQSLRELQSGLGEIPCMPATTRSLQVHDLMDELLAAPSMELMDFLGFRLKDLAGAVYESQYAHPLLLAHITGLRAQCLTLLDYRDGIEHYLSLVAPVLRQRRVPEATVCDLLACFTLKGALTGHRKRANALLAARYGLSEAQLVCMLFAPFVEEGAGLSRYLQHCHPRLPMEHQYLHDALQGNAAPASVVRWLTETSGLPMNHLCKLYAMARVHVDDDQDLLVRPRLWPLSPRGVRGLHPVTGLAAYATNDPTDV